MRVVVYLYVLAIFGCCLCLTQPDHGCKQTMDGDKTTKPCVTRETYKVDYYNILGKTTPYRLHPGGVSIGSRLIEKQSKVGGHVTVDQYSDLSVDELISLLESVQADPGTKHGTVGYKHQTDDNLLITRRKRSISRRFPIPRPKPPRPIPIPRPKPRPIPKPRPKPRPIPRPRPKPRRPKPRKPSPKPRRPRRRRIGRG